MLARFVRSSSRALLASSRPVGVRSLSVLAGSSRYQNQLAFRLPRNNTLSVRSFSDGRDESSAGGNEKETGVVKWFDAAKGFGFVIRDGGQDLFVHYSCINGDGYRVLEEGQVVEFWVADGAKGPVAMDVTVVGDTAGDDTFE